MADSDWELFKMVVSHFELPIKANDVLGTSAVEFDQVNDKFDSAVLFPLQGPADELLRRLAEQFNLDQPYDVDGDK
jgi:hypothetical protein